VYKWANSEIGDHATLIRLYSKFNSWFAYNIADWSK
ncbi:unnamed protein product, partial [marine sediment metagenome]